VPVAHPLGALESLGWFSGQPGSPVGGEGGHRSRKRSPFSIVLDSRQCGAWLLLAMASANGHA
jgi:hypothetical protein